MPLTPEQLVREKIDAQLVACDSRNIVAEPDRRLSVVEELEAVVSANLERAARAYANPSSKKRFSGELVP